MRMHVTIAAASDSTYFPYRYGTGTTEQNAVWLLVPLSISSSAAHRRYTRWRLQMISREAPGQREVILMGNSGPIKKPNATQSLGAVRSISVPSDDTCASKYGINKAVIVC